MDLTIQTKVQHEHPDDHNRIGMTMGNIWFSSEKHKENFIHLLEKFKKLNAYKSTAYASSAYIVSHPGIHHQINWDACSTPISWYWGTWVGENEDDANGYYEESAIVGKLSSAYGSLVRAAVEMYSNQAHHFNLMAWLTNTDDEVYKLFVQALEIRRDSFVIEVPR